MLNLQKTFQYHLAIKYGLIEEHIKPIQFYFETKEDMADQKQNHN